MNKYKEGLLSGLGAAFFLAYMAWCISTGIQRDQEYLDANDARIEREIERRAGWSK